MNSFDSDVVHPQLALSKESVMMPVAGAVSIVKTTKAIPLGKAFGVDFFLAPPTSMFTDILVSAWSVKSTIKEKEVTMGVWFHTIKLHYLPSGERVLKLSPKQMLDKKLCCTISFELPVLQPKSTLEPNEASSGDAQDGAQCEGDAALQRANGLDKKDEQGTGGEYETMATKKWLRAPLPHELSSRDGQKGKKIEMDSVGFSGFREAVRNFRPAGTAKMTSEGKTSKEAKAAAKSLAARARHLLG